MMRLIPRRSAALPAVLSACLLAACGGGGGDDPATRLSYDTARVEVTAFRGQMQDTNAFQEASVTVTVTATNPPAGGAYIAVGDSGSGFGNQPIEVLQLSATQFQVTLHPQVGIDAGVYTGNLTVFLCKDLACSGRYPVQNASLPYQVTITPQLTAEVKVDGSPIYTLSSDLGSDRIGVESPDSEVLVEFTTSIPTSVHHSSGTGMLQVEVDPSSTSTYWKLRVTRPALYYGGGLALGVWPEDASKGIQHGVTFDVDLLSPPGT